jgi:hypothetical protein
MGRACEDVVGGWSNRLQGRFEHLVVCMDCTRLIALHRDSIASFVAPCSQGWVGVMAYTELGRCSVEFQLLYKTYMHLVHWLSLLSPLTALLGDHDDSMRRLLRSGIS